MNTSNILELVLSGFVMSFTCHYIWLTLTNIKLKGNILKILLSFFLLVAILMFNYNFINSYLKIIVSAFCSFALVYIFICRDVKKSIVLTLFSESLYILSEIIFSIIMLLIFRDNLPLVMNKYFGSLLTNFCISSIAFFEFMLPMSKKIYNFLFNIILKIKTISITLLTFVLIVSVNIFLATPYYKTNTLLIVIINSVLLLVYTVIILKFIQAKNRYIDISDKYSLSEASLKEVQNNVNRLMALNHENKNQLITIRTMVANKDKDILKNIDAIVDQKIKDDKELKIRTSVISNTMLGSLIYSKLLTMKENNINHNLHISKAINKSHLINLGDKTNVDICKIVGVYLDNAIEAVMEVDVKEINIDLYLEDAYFCISIANTFKGKVNLDTITDYGYTTKSNGHGYGLSLVKEVIKDNNALSSKTDIIDNKVFVQNLKIKM